YVYNLASPTPTVPIAILNNPSPGDGDYFGRSVAVSGNYVVVGAPYDNMGAFENGSAHVYNLASPTPTVPIAILNNPSPADGDQFGYSVAVAGNYVVVSAPFDDTGAFDAGSAYVYNLASPTPTVPIAILNNPSPADGDQFGRSVAVSGTDLFIGAPFDDTQNLDQGATYVYSLDTTPPTVSSITRASPNPTSGPSVQFTVTFSENVQASTVNPADFTLTATGSATGTVASVTPVTGNVYTVTVTGVGGSGTLRLDVPASATILDLAGNPLATPYTSGEVYDVIIPQGLNVRLFDFNSASSNVTQAGYTGVLRSELYTAAKGYGYLVSPAALFDRTTVPGAPGNAALLRDGHWSAGTGNARLFRIDVSSPGTYQIFVTLGDTSAPHTNMAVSVVADGSATGTAVSGLTTSGNFTVAILSAVITGDHVTLRFEDTDTDSSGWAVNAVELRGTGTVGTFTLHGPSTATADGLTVDTYTASGASPGALYTLSTTGVAGTLLVADASTIYQGVQVQASASGTFSFQVLRPTGAGVGTYSATGLGHGLSASAATTYALPLARFFDFNGPSNVTATGYLGVRGSTNFTTTRAYGWLTAPLDADRGTSHPLHRDFVWGNSSATFRVLVDSSVSYTIKPYFFDNLQSYTGIKVYVDGTLLTTVNVPVNTLVSPAIVLGPAYSADGVLDITIEKGGSFFILNGLDIVSPQLAAGGVRTDGMPVPALTAAELAPVVQQAKAWWVSRGADPAAFDNVRFEISQLNRYDQGYLALQLDRQTIAVDASAAGHGWSVDPWVVQPGRVDLLTVVMHELGHVLGLGSLDPQVYADDLMTATLAPGVRRGWEGPGNGVLTRPVTDQLFSSFPTLNRSSDERANGWAAVSDVWTPWLVAVNPLEPVHPAESSDEPVMAGSRHRETTPIAPSTASSSPSAKGSFAGWWSGSMAATSSRRRVVRYSGMGASGSIGEPSHTAWPVLGS
ncbi:MAG: Ig-like domain-containing protein, partial [Gemmataceae bacterium]|nr:Ig-like domain-containing protein [Gemmataceae bacterium]